MNDVKETSKFELVKKELELLMESYQKIIPKKYEIFLNRFFKMEESNEENLEYVSLALLRKILWKCTYNYYSYINNYTRSIADEFSTSNSQVKVYIKDSIVYVEDNETVLMKVDCNTLPCLIEGDSKKYEYIKKYICLLVPIQKEYMEFLNTFENRIKIGEISKITISNEYGISHPSIALEIGEHALYEICYNSGSIQIITFSNDLEVNKKLNERKHELYEQICIPKEKISNLFNTYKRIMLG